MLKVVIKAPANHDWVDHAGNPINELVFSKESERQYVSGHYSIESYGQLDRNIDDFRKSPLQSLSDWEISLPSVFSSKDGSFKTIDLLYWLEAKNEEMEKNFDLTGSEVILYDGEDSIFQCVVNSTATSGLRSDIRFSERLGSPEIKASFFPTVIGEASVDRWQVQIIKNFHRFRLIISDRLVSVSQFYIYMEKSSKYIPVEFASSVNEVRSDSKYISNTWIELAPPVERVAQIDELMPNDLIVIKDNQKALETLMTKIRPSWNEKETLSTPDIISIGGEKYFNSFNPHEFAEAWSSYIWTDENTADSGYALGRTDPRGMVRAQPYESRVGVNMVTDTVNIKFKVEYPINDMVTGPCVSSSAFYSGVRTRGNLQSMRDISEEYSSRVLSEDEWEQVPTIKIISHDANFYLDLNFPIDLPSKAKVTGMKLWSRLRFNTSNLFFIRLYIEQNEVAYFSCPGTGENSWSYAWNLSMEKLENESIADLGKIRMKLEPFNYSDIWLQIAGLRLALDVEMPLEDVNALYASGTLFDPPPPGEVPSNSVAKSVQELLAATQIDSAFLPEVKAIEPLNEVQYGNVMRNESALLRDKLRSLAAESGTLIKFSPDANKIILKSVSRMHPHESKLIELKAFVLSNNMYSFKMESPYRNDIASGVVISWGKNVITGKYEHILEINGQGAYKDGVSYNLDSQWNSVLNQLQKGLGSVKNLNTEWIMNWEGAEIMAYDYLCWNCAPLRKAQAECITSEIPADVDIGEFVQFDLPGYPPKFALTSWIVTGMHNDLDKYITTIELLEVWDMPAVSENRYLLLENGKNILLEDSEKIKLEKISDG